MVYVEELWKSQPEPVQDFQQVEFWPQGEALHQEY